MSEELEIVINARDYASETLHGITGSVRALGMSTVMLASNFAMLTREAGIQIPVLNTIIKTMEIIGVTFRAVGAAMRIYEAITKAAAVAEWAHNAALAFKIALIPIVGAAIVMGALAVAAAVRAPSMQYGGVVSREGIYYLHPGELVIPRTEVSVSPQVSPEIVMPRPEVLTRTGPTHQTVNVYFENRAPISSEVDKESLLRDLGREVAEKTRRAGYR